MKSRGQIAYEGYYAGNPNYLVDIPWSSLNDHQRRRWEEAGKAVVDYYARIMNADDNEIIAEGFKALADAQEGMLDILQRMYAKTLKEEEKMPSTLVDTLETGNKGTPKTKLDPLYDEQFYTGA